MKQTICIAGKNDIAVDVLSYCLKKYNECGIELDTRIVDCWTMDIVLAKKSGSIIDENEVSYTISTIDYDVIIYKDVLNILFNAISNFDNKKAKKLCASKNLNEKDEHG